MKRSDSGHKDGNRSHLHGKYLIIDFLMMMIMMCVCVCGGGKHCLWPVPHIIQQFVQLVTEMATGCGFMWL